MSKVVESQQPTTLPATGEHLRNARSALSIWLASFRSHNTRRAYEKELQAFADFCGAELDDAAAWLLTRVDPEAHNAADLWRADKLARGNAPATINRSMAALNSFVTSARRGGFTTLRLEAKGEAREAYRDTAGPGLTTFLKMLDAARQQRNKHSATRDAAILLLAFGLGLRRAEIVAINIDNIDLETGRVMILGKGKAQAKPLTLTPELVEALGDWMHYRRCSEDHAPLFVSLSRASKDRRLTGDGVRKVIARIGNQVGAKVRPHGLRHTATTEALSRVGGDFRKVRSFSRHSSLDIIAVYDDARQDHAGQVAAILTGLTKA